MYQICKSINVMHVVVVVIIAVCLLLGNLIINLYFIHEIHTIYYRIRKPLNRKPCIFCNYIMDCHSLPTARIKCNKSLYYTTCFWMILELQKCKTLTGITLWGKWGSISMTTYSWSSYTLNTYEQHIICLIDTSF